MNALRTDWTTVDPAEQRLIAKLMDRAPFIGSKEHLAKIMEMFPVEHQAQLLAEINPLLKEELRAKP